MSFSNLMSGISYGVMGFMVGGWYGAAVGFAIGIAMSLAMDALAPDVPSPGGPEISELSYPSAQEGLNIPDVLGTTKLSGNIFQYFGSRVVELEEDAGSKGIGGGGSFVTGYEYYLSWAMGICLGPIDCLYTVYSDNDVLWSGELQRPVSGGVEVIDLTLGESVESVVGVTVTASVEYSKLASEGYYGGYYRYTFTGLK